MLGRPGLLEIVLIAAMVLLILGPRRIPELARSIAQSLRLFRKEYEEPSASADPSNDPDSVSSNR